MKMNAAKNQYVYVASFSGTFWRYCTRLHVQFTLHINLLLFILQVELLWETILESQLFLRKSLPAEKKFLVLMFFKFG